MLKEVTSSLLAKFLIFCLVLSILSSGIFIAISYSVRDRQMSEEISNSINNFAHIQGQLIRQAERGQNWQLMHQLLRGFLAFNYVACTDYQDEQQRALITWPPEGCAGIQGLSEELIVRVSDTPERNLKIGLNSGYARSVLQRESLYLGGLSWLLLAGVLALIIVYFRHLVMRPLQALVQAMINARPDNLREAPVYAKDEIGKVAQTYNRQVAAFKIYIRRLTKSQALLTESEKRFRDMAEISGDWFFEMDSDLRLSFISNRFFELLDIERDQVIGKRRDELSQNQQNSEIWTAHLDDLANHRPFRHFEYPFRLNEKDTRILSISGRPVFDEDGRFTGYRGVGSDVTELHEKEQMLAEANRNFGESVTYASSIQRGLLPDKAQLDEILGQSVTIWQPVDLVGGDFYWVGQISGVQYLVFFDCTGHGVPGAFMTLITTSVIEQIASSVPIAPSAPQMLQRIHDGVCKALALKPGDKGHDGLDCAVIRMNRSEDSLSFAGASIDLFEVPDGGAVIRHRGSRKTLGYEIKDAPLDIPETRLTMGSASFVLSTDGLMTQVGQETKRVMGTRRFVEILETAESNAPGKLARGIARGLKNWQGNETRRDDVTIICFKPNS